MSTLHIWTIYDRPLDFPDRVVVRRFEVTGGQTRATPGVSVHETLDQARASLSPGLFCFPRQAGDEPQIVECWL